MLRALAIVIELGLLVFALIDCIQTDSAAVRNLPKMFWVMIIILVPVAGPVAWLVAGRPAYAGSRTHTPWQTARSWGFGEHEPTPRGPDDEPEFLAGLRESDRKHEQMLKDWETQLREREERLRERETTQEKKNEKE
jgi:hypothetical protein